MEQMQVKLNFPKKRVHLRSIVTKFSEKTGPFEVDLRSIVDIFWKSRLFLTHKFNFLPQKVSFSFPCKLFWNVSGKNGPKFWKFGEKMVQQILENYFVKKINRDMFFKIVK